MQAKCLPSHVRTFPPEQSPDGRPGPAAVPPRSPRKEERKRAPQSPPPNKKNKTRDNRSHTQERGVLSDHPRGRDAPTALGTIPTASDKSQHALRHARLSLAWRGWAGGRLPTPARTGANRREVARNGVTNAASPLAIACPSHDARRPATTDWIHASCHAAALT